MEPQLWRRPLLVIPTAIVLTSLAVLGSRIMSVQWGCLWLDQLRLKYKSRKLKTPVPLDIERWRCKGMDVFDDVILYREIEINNSWWDFLTTAWRNRGYALYVIRKPREICLFIPLPVDGKPNGQQSFPYGRCSYETNNEGRISMATKVACVRAARDSLGRDVVIRLVSNRSNPTTELQILRYLSSATVLQDPRNITIPIVDEQEIYGLIFVVMPRWDDAFKHDFATVTELLDAAEAFLNYLDFLHEHRIAHMDLHSANTAVNTVTSSEVFYAKGLRDPNDTRYAVYDFGESYMYPLDTPIDSVEEIHEHGAGWGIDGLVEANIPFNPFRVDVAAMGRFLRRFVRVLQDDIPEIVPFFEAMLDDDPMKRPTAHEALCQFRHIRANLTPEKEAGPVRGTHWHPIAGVSYKKEYKKQK